MGQESFENDYRHLGEESLEHLYSGGEQLAYEELWRRHEKSFERQAHRRSRGDPVLAEETVPELRVKLADPGIQRTYDPGKGRWSGWAVAILNHIVTDLQRKRASRKFIIWKQTLAGLEQDGVPVTVCDKLREFLGKVYFGEDAFRVAVRTLLTDDEYDEYADTIVKQAEKERRQEPLELDGPRSGEKSPADEAALHELGDVIEAG